MMVRINVDLPQPDLPTTPRMRPVATDRLTLSRIEAVPSSVRIETLSPLTSKIGIIGIAAGAGRPDRAIRRRAN